MGSLYYDLYFVLRKLPGVEMALGYQTLVNLVKMWTNACGIRVSMEELALTCMEVNFLLFLYCVQYTVGFIQYI